jgi:hypothetical protein
MAVEEGSGRESRHEGPPGELPQTTPPSTEYLGWILHTITEINRTTGELSKSVETLTDQVKKHDEKLDRISHRIYAAVVVLTVIGGILLWLLNAASDDIIALAKEVLIQSAK